MNLVDQQRNGSGMDRPLPINISSASPSRAKRTFRRMFGTRFTPRQVILSLYEGLLRRRPDSDGLAAYVRSLENDLSLTNAVKDFIDSAEFGRIAYGIARNNAPLARFASRDIVVSLYEALALPCPDSEHLTEIVQSLEDSGSLTNIFRDFIDRTLGPAAEQIAKRRAAWPGHEADATGGDGATKTNTKVTILQSCDPIRYLPLLTCGRVANQHYAITHGFDYSTFIGIKRGYFPWHACFNRLFMLKELVDAGYRGWVLYLDADAYVYAQSFDLRAYLDGNTDKALIAGPGAEGGPKWDINDGIFLMNLGHEHAMEIVTLWHRYFMDTPDAALRAAENWEDVPSDQPLLHDILRSIPRLMDHLVVMPRFFFAVDFTRQMVRTGNNTLDERLQVMRTDIGTLGIRSPC